MNPKAKATILSLVDELLTKGERLAKITTRPSSDGGIVYTETIYPGEEVQYHEWDAHCLNLVRLLGDVGEHWSRALQSTSYGVDYGTNASIKVGTLKAIKAALDKGLLVTAEELIRAEMFNDLLEQAEYLYSQNFVLAAGVLGRAILEEHLRKWCDKEKCAPTKPKPTLNDFNSALYTAKHLNTMEMKHVDSLIAVGNLAAHNKPELTPEAVQRLLREARDFVTKHPV